MPRSRAVTPRKLNAEPCTAAPRFERTTDPRRRKPSGSRPTCPPCGSPEDRILVVGADPLQVLRVRSLAGGILERTACCRGMTRVGTAVPLDEPPRRRLGSLRRPRPPENRLHNGRSLRIDRLQAAGPSRIGQESSDTRHCGRGVVRSTRRHLRSDGDRRRQTLPKGFRERLHGKNLQSMFPVCSEPATDLGARRHLS